MGQDQGTERSLGFKCFELGLHTMLNVNEVRIAQKLSEVREEKPENTKTQKLGEQVVNLLFRTFYAEIVFKNRN